MKIAGRFSFNSGQEAVECTWPGLLAEVESAIAGIDAAKHKRKKSKEKTMKGQLLYSPISINRDFKKRFAALGGWSPVRVPCEYSTSYYVPNYDPKRLRGGAFREMDFIRADSVFF